MVEKGANPNPFTRPDFGGVESKEVPFVQRPVALTVSEARLLPSIDFNIEQHCDSTSLCHHAEVRLNWMGEIRTRVLTFFLEKSSQSKPASAATAVSVPLRENGGKGDSTNDGNELCDC